MGNKDWTLTDVRGDIERAPKAVHAFTATAVRYVPERRELEVRLDTGLGLLIPLAMIPEIEGATEDDLADVAVFYDAIEWERLDMHLNTTGLIIDALGPAVLRTELGRRSGAAKSAAKVAAARENGKKGGRPKKAAQG